MKRNFIVTDAQREVLRAVRDAKQTPTRREIARAVCGPNANGSERAGAIQSLLTKGLLRQCGNKTYAITKAGMDIVPRPAYRVWLVLQRTGDGIVGPDQLYAVSPHVLPYFIRTEAEMYFTDCAEQLLKVRR